jgi:hypothetical protein
MTTPTPPRVDLSAVDIAKRNTFEAINRVFESYGLGQLAPKVLEFVQAGYDANTITLLLQDTAEYKQRFKGNEARAKAGLPVLSPAEYVSVERSYAQVMRSYGLPPTFYDSADDFADLISRDVAPTEVQRRVENAARFVQSQTDYMATFREYYGNMTDGMAIAYMLDPDKATPVIDRLVNAVDIGTEARRMGANAPTRERAEYLAEMGVDRERARSGYSQIGEVLPATERIAERFGDQYTQADAEDEVFGGLASARRKRERLQKSEVALFRGQGGVQRGSLNNTASGSY